MKLLARVVVVHVECDDAALAKHGRNAGVKIPVKYTPMKTPIHIAAYRWESQKISTNCPNPPPNIFDFFYQFLTYGAT